VTFAKTPGAAKTGGKGIVSIAMRGGPLNKIAPKSPIGSAKGQTAKPVAVAHAPLQAPVRTPKPRPEPKPAAPAPVDPFEIGRIGSSWSLLKLSDTTGKRGLARCLACGIVREITVVGDDPPSCGCTGSRRPDASARTSSFAASSFIPGLRRARSS
jgi:hypothetical protein